MLSFTAVYGEHCGTSYAAKVLGVSVGTVHGLIQSGQLQAWRTKGGHHRISLESLERHAVELGLSVSKGLINDRQNFRVMIIEDDKENQNILRLIMTQWGISPVVRESGASALLDIALFRPRILLLSTGIIGLDFCELIKVLKSKYGSKIQIIAMLP